MSVPPGVGYVYLWTNNVNGKKYIGSHCGSNPRYTASGIGIRRAFTKYGMENFTRDILYAGDDFREEENRILMEIDAASDPMYYNRINTASGFDPGELNPMYGSNRTGDKNPMYGRKHTEASKEIQRLRSLNMSDETKRKMSESSKGKRAPNKGIKHAPDVIMKQSMLKKGELNPMWGRKHSEETIEKMRKSHTGRVMVYSTRICDICGLSGKGPNMTRYHFSNCKKME